MVFDPKTWADGELITAADLNRVEQAVDAVDEQMGSKVDATDPRLSDARPPTAHTHPITDVGGLQAALPRIDSTAGTRVFAGDVMLYGETGWRDLTPYLAAGVTPSSNIPDARFRRVDDMVEFAMKVDLADDFTGAAICTFPAGFRAPSYRYLPGAYTAPEKGATASVMVPVSMIGYVSSAVLQTPSSKRLPAGSTLIWGGRFDTKDPWPNTLPSTPA